MMNVYERAEQVLIEFVEAAEPKRPRKIKRVWWWQPPRSRSRSPSTLLVPTGKQEEPMGFFPEPLVIPWGMA